MQIDLEWLAVISDTVHRAHFNCPADVLILSWICRLLKDVVVRRIIAVHEVLQGKGKTDTATVAGAGDEILPGNVFLQSDSNRGHKNLLLLKCRKPIVGS
jgi:hypothetical protein